MLNYFLISIVLYKEKLSDSPSFITLNEGIPKNSKISLLVYDNSPEPQKIDPITEKWNIIYIHNSNNEGISKAYNESANIAERLNKKWLLFADQDTHFPISFLHTLISAIKKNTTIQIFSPILRSGKIVISPCWVYWEKAFPMRCPLTGVQKLKNRSIINSGLCISLQAFKIAGGYKNDIRLDFSDHYFFRSLKKHYKYLYIIEGDVEHSLSIFTDSLTSNAHRFKYYCDGARKYSNFATFIPVFIVCTYRMLKQSILNKSLCFISSYFRYYITSHTII